MLFYCQIPVQFYIDGNFLVCEHRIKYSVNYKYPNQNALNRESFADVARLDVGPFSIAQYGNPFPLHQFNRIYYMVPVNDVSQCAMHQCRWPSFNGFIKLRYYNEVYFLSFFPFFFFVPECTRRGIYADLRTDLLNHMF